MPRYGKENKILSGKITICGSRSDNMVSIKIVDKLSRVIVCDTILNKENFAKAIFGLAEIDCSFDIYPDALCVIGKTKENKMASIERPNPSIYDKKELLKYLQEKGKEFEVDGWIGEYSWATKTQQNDPDVYRVNFYRYI